MFERSKNNYRNHLKENVLPIRLLLGGLVTKFLNIQKTSNGYTTTSILKGILVSLQISTKLILLLLLLLLF